MQFALSEIKAHQDSTGRKLTSLRVVVHRWPAVPTQAKRAPLTTMSRSAVSSTAREETQSVWSEQTEETQKNGAHQSEHCCLLIPEDASLWMNELKNEHWLKALKFQAYMKQTKSLCDSDCNLVANLETDDKRTGEKMQVMIKGRVESLPDSFQWRTPEECARLWRWLPWK